MNEKLMVGHKTNTNISILQLNTEDQSNGIMLIFNKGTTKRMHPLGI